MASDLQPPCTRGVEISALGEGATEPLPQIGRHVLGRTQGTSLSLLGLGLAGRRAVLVHTSTGQPGTPQPTRAPLGAAVRRLWELGLEQALERRQQYCPRLKQIFPIPPNPSSALSRNEMVKKKIEQLSAMIFVPILPLCMIHMTFTAVKESLSYI
jgi:hypothetical protein